MDCTENRHFVYNYKIFDEGPGNIKEKFIALFTFFLRATIVGRGGTHVYTQIWQSASRNNPSNPTLCTHPQHQSQTKEYNNRNSIKWLQSKRCYKKRITKIKTWEVSSQSKSRCSSYVGKQKSCKTMVEYALPETRNAKISGVLPF